MEKLSFVPYKHRITKLMGHPCLLESKMRLWSHMWFARKDEHFENLDKIMVTSLNNCGHIGHCFGYLKF